MHAERCRDELLVGDGCRVSVMLATMSARPMINDVFDQEK
jgi:hypothetical protein